MTGSSSDLVIVGSRLQALIYSWGGLVALAVLWSRRPVVALLIGLAGLGLGFAVYWRRFVLGKNSVSARSIAGTRTAGLGEIAADFGHRYLKIEFDDGLTKRIEVPVEIRPQVREWTDSVGVHQPNPDC